MAIVKTTDTLSLAAGIKDAIKDAIGVLDDVVSRVSYMVDQVANPTPYNESADGTKVVETQVGHSSATYTDIKDAYIYPWDQGNYYAWPLYITFRLALTGTNFDKSGAAASIATGFAMSNIGHSSLNVAGYSGELSWQERATATIERELSSNALEITKSNYTWVSHSLSGGFDKGSNGTTGSSDVTKSESFDGLAKYNLSSLALLTIKSYACSETSATTNSSFSPSPTTKAYSFQLKSAVGFTLDCGIGGGMAGAIDQFLYSNVESNYGYAKESDYFKYANTSSPIDDIDLKVLENYYFTDSWDYRAQWMAELFKANDTILVSDAGGGAIYAGAGNDKVTGAKGDDALYGQEGDDRVDGGDGEDHIEGGEGNDNLKGGAGNDEILGDNGYDLIDGGAGRDKLYGGAGNDRLLGGLSDDWLYGEAGDDYLDGGSGNDDLLGGAGSDILKGGAGNDRLRGEAGDDILDGGAGNDLIIGGAGVDVMTGGTGVDGFWFGTGDSGLTLGTLDQIKGFNVVQDQILFNFSFADSDISVLDASASYASLLATAEAANKRIVVGYDEGNTYVFADMDNNGSVDLAVQLVGIKGAAVANALTFDYLPL